MRIVNLSFFIRLLLRPPTLQTFSHLRFNTREMNSKLFLLFFFLSSPAPSMAAGAYNSFVYAGCSEAKFDPVSSYQTNLASLFTSLSNAASFSSYSKFTVSLASSSAAVSGLFQCRGDLAISECGSCIHSAISQLSQLCPSAAGGAMQLVGCYLRYGNDSFIGKTDTSLLYKKCGPPGAPSGGNDLGMRDSALSSMSAAAGSPAGGNYRVGAAGYVQAMAQCVGDQSGKQCDDCISAAVTQLRASCTSAVVGDVYLGKCYAKYWSNGVYGDSHHDHGDDDETGKTVAIIIGLMAGIALIIIFLSFLGKAGEYYGKY